MPRTESASSADVGTLAQEHDCLLLDLDGTVFRGHELTEGAAESLEKAAGQNAIRHQQRVAQRRPGRRAPARPRPSRPTADDVVTSAQSAAHVLADQLSTGISGAGRRTGVAGRRNLRRRVCEPVRQLRRPTRRRRARPLTGNRVGRSSPRRRWPSGPARSGWPPMSTPPCRPNADCCPATVRWWPRCRAATDAEPQVAGKPAPTLLLDALKRGDFRTPLVVGDRLNTDIAGANAAKLPSLMVLTGVNSARDAVYAVPEQRATFIGHDLRRCTSTRTQLAVGPQPAWQVDARDNAITVSSAATDDAGDGLSIVRAVAHAVWSGRPRRKDRRPRSRRRHRPRRPAAVVPDA